MQILKLYLISILIFLPIDIVWISKVASVFYKNELGPMLRESFKPAPALFFYLMFCLGLVVFVINPAIELQSWKRALGMGALFGFITYLTFDATSYSIFKHFPLKVAIIDSLWGATIAGAVSVISYFIAQNLFSQ